MHPVICKIGPVTIYSYGLMFALAAFVCIFLLSKEAKRQGFNQDVIIDFAFWILVSGIIGARFFYLFSNPLFFLENPGEILMLWHGGLVWYGGLIGATIFGLLYLKKKNLPVLKILDMVAPFVALGQSIGRVGCFLNGCCFGKPRMIFPAQLVSSFNLFVIFLILRHKQKKANQPGEILFLYLMLAALERFIVEFFRGDSAPFIWNLTLFQIISLIIFAISLYGKILIKGRKRIS